MAVHLIEGLPDTVVGVRATGTVRGADYEDVIGPAIDAKLADHDKVRLMYVLDEGFEGYSGDAAWEDGKIGMAHFTRFEKIAFVSDRDMIRHTINAVGYLIPGKLKVFALDEQADATEWISA